LQQKTPHDVVPDQEKKVELLKLFNYHWQDWRFRDIIEPRQRYSDDQKLYFDTLPKDRKPLVRELRQKYLQQGLKVDIEGGDNADVKDSDSICTSSSLLS